MSIRTPDRRIMEYMGMAAAVTFAAILGAAAIWEVVKLVAWLLC